MEKYLELLNLFKEKQLMSAAEIESALAAGNRALAIRIAHTLKGAAGNIGVDDVFIVATEIERKLKEDVNLENIKDQLQLLADALKIVTHSIEDVLTMRDRENYDLVVSAVSLEEKLKVLASMVEKNQVEAFDLFKEISQQLKQLYGQDVLEKLNSAIISFDWDHAGELLNSIRGG